MRSITAYRGFLPLDKLFPAVHSNVIMLPAQDPNWVRSFTFFFLEQFHIIFSLTILSYIFPKTVEYLTDNSYPAVVVCFIISKIRSLDPEAFFIFDVSQCFFNFKTLSISFLSVYSVKLCTIHIFWHFSVNKFCEMIIQVFF